MAIISFDIGVHGARINAAFAATYGYQATLEDGTANPQTVGQFTRTKIRDHIKRVVTDYEATQAAEAARTSKVAEVEAQVTIT